MTFFMVFIVCLRVGVCVCVDGRSEIILRSSNENNELLNFNEIVWHSHRFNRINTFVVHCGDKVGKKNMVCG